MRGVEEKPYSRKPAAPFTTSTLQQEASRKLRFSSRQTMRVAQGLYENGYITYMRTDSVNLSEQALGAARRQAAELYGPEFVPDRPRLYATQGQERAGGARGDPPVRRRLPDAGAGVGAAERRRVPPLRAHLEAHGRLPDGRRAGLDGHGPARRDDRRRPRRRVLGVRAPSSPSAGSSPPTRRAGTTTAPSRARRTTSSGACRRSRPATVSTPASCTPTATRRRRRRATPRRA